MTLAKFPITVDDPILSNVLQTLPLTDSIRIVLSDMEMTFKTLPIYHCDDVLDACFEKRGMCANLRSFNYVSEEQLIPIGTHFALEINMNFILPVRVGAYISIGDVNNPIAAGILDVDEVPENTTQSVLGLTYFYYPENNSYDYGSTAFGIYLDKDGFIIPLHETLGFYHNPRLASSDYESALLAEAGNNIIMTSLIGMMIAKSRGILQCDEYKMGDKILRAAQDIGYDLSPEQYWVKINE